VAVAQRAQRDRLCNYHVKVDKTVGGRSSCPLKRTKTAAGKGLSKTSEGKGEVKANGASVGGRPPTKSNATELPGGKKEVLRELTRLKTGKDDLNSRDRTWNLKRKEKKAGVKIWESGRKVRTNDHRKQKRPHLGSIKEHGSKTKNALGEMVGYCRRTKGRILNGDSSDTGGKEAAAEPLANCPQNEDDEDSASQWWDTLTKIATGR